MSFISCEDLLTLSELVAVLCVVVLGKIVVGPLTSVFALRESDVVAVLAVDSVGEMVVIMAVSINNEFSRFARQGGRISHQCWQSCTRASSVNHTRVRQPIK